jgi:hypothetical protein
VNEREIIRYALVAGLLDAEKIGRVPRHQAAPQHPPARLQQVKKRAAAPVLRRHALIRAAIFDDLGGFRPVGTPAECETFINRVQRVENDKGARQRHPGLAEPPAEAGQQLALAAADQPGLGHPSAEGVQCRFVHKGVPLGCSKPPNRES